MRWHVNLSLATALDITVGCLLAAHWQRGAWLLLEGIQCVCVVSIGEPDVEPIGDTVQDVVCISCV